MTLQVIARRPDQYLLRDSSLTALDHQHPVGPQPSPGTGDTIMERMGRILDLDRRVLTGPVSIQATLAQGYWMAHTLTQAELDILLAHVRVEAEDTRRDT